MRRMFIGVLLAATMIAFFLGLASNLAIRSSNVQDQPGNTIASTFDTSIATVVPSSIPSGTATARKIVVRLPAVDKDGNGALADLTVEAVQGSGRVFIGFDASPLVNSDTQGSLRIAYDVAKRMAQTDAKTLDVFYTFSTQSDVVGGKSAGAAAAVATIAALSEASLRRDVLLTGTIEPDGSIGPVGKILEKAKAAKEAGFRTFLVPVGESKQNVVVEECREKRSSGVFVRECSSRTQSVDIASKVPGLQIVEVKDVSEAYNLIKTG